MKNILKSALIALLCLFSIVGLFAEETTLVKFNVLETEDAPYTWNPNGVTNFGSQTDTKFGPYLVFNHKVDLENDTIVIEATVNYSSTSGHNGIGFIKTDGSLCGGYTLLTAQNMKNQGGKGGGDGFDPAIDWTANTGKDLKFKVVQEEGLHKFYVYDASGILMSKREDKSSLNNFEATDIIYPAIGGTNTANMTWKDVKFTINGTEYTINGLRPQTDLPVLSVETPLVRGEMGEGELDYTCIAPGGETSTITVESADESIIKIISASDGVIKYEALSTGTTMITITNDAANYIKYNVTFVITKYPAANNYTKLNVYPSSGATDCYVDGSLMMEFDSEPTLALGGSLAIFKASDNTLVDTIAFEDEVQSVVSGYNINVGNQLVRKDGNKLYITPHFGALEYNTEYYIAIPDAVITALMAGTEFKGLSAASKENGWYFTTRSAPTIGTTITVDSSHESRADFRTIYGALCAIKDTDGDFKINLASGTYYELISYKTTKNQTITISGPEGNNKGDNCVISYINCNDMNGSTHTRSVMYMSSINLVLKNLSIKNLTKRGEQYVSTVEPTGNTQAETIHFANGIGKTLAAYNCSFSSHQDTILTTGKNWFYKCYLEGDTDFLWGTADACLFEQCELRSLYDENAKTHVSYLMVARTGTKGASKIGKGYVIKDCNITVENDEVMYFGRNAGAGDYYDQCAVIDTYIGPEKE